MSDYKGFAVISSPLFSKEVNKLFDGTKQEYIDFQVELFNSFMEYAENNGLCPIVSGGLFKGNDNYEFVVPMISCLSKFNIKPIIVLSENDMTRKELSKDGPLSILIATGAVEPFSEKGWIAKALINKQLTGLYGVPYGQDIPKGVRKTGEIENASLLFSDKPKNIETGHLFRGVDSVITSFGYNNDKVYDYQESSCSWFVSPSFKKLDANTDAVMTIYDDNGIEMIPVVSSFGYKFLDANIEQELVGLSVLEDSSFVNMLKESEADSYALFDNEIDNEISNIEASENYSDASKQIIRNLYKDVLKEENDELGL